MTPDMPAMDEKGLDACPFCGSDGKPRLFDFDGEPYVPGYEVRCDASGWDGMEERGCGATSGWGETQAEAIAAWNRRALAATARDGDGDTATEQELRDLFSMEDEDGPLEDVVATHSGEWRREGDIWRWHQGEELAVVRVSSDCASLKAVPEVEVVKADTQLVDALCAMLRLFDDRHNFVEGPTQTKVAIKNAHKALWPDSKVTAPNPYAYEYGRSNGDGTFSVVIERGEPNSPVSDWPVKPLFATPQPAPDAEVKP